MIPDVIDKFTGKEKKVTTDEKIEEAIDEIG